jgi:copper chaperone CopZ
MPITIGDESDILANRTFRSIGYFEEGIEMKIVNTPSNPTTASATRPLTLPLYNLSCAADGQVIERILKQEPGVVKVYANPATEKVYIEYETVYTNRDRLQHVLQQAGFGQKTGRVTCAHCG